MTVSASNAALSTNTKYKESATESPWCSLYC
nr:MAG TPA: hypothetical protein [Caudoviricetes sp.]DAS79257.1 MAG TPA: hypothetical protein [Caudoviricetes sp.]